MLGPFFDGFRINERLLGDSCGNESKASLFFSGRLFRNSSIHSSRSMRAPCLLGVVASRGTGRGECRKCSMRENMIPAAYLRIISVTNRCLEKVRCFGMFSHTIVENVKRRRVGRTGTERQNGRKAHVVMCNWGIGIADLQGILGMLRLKSLLFGVVSVRM